ncbi:MAG: hypothetical protein CBC83_00170 [Flavobacteriales bacterium TMED123]|nr:MAG: hypothetical protein CBC83_00170 [Flavobacteriales bacterium TMED123]
MATTSVGEKEMSILLDHFKVDYVREYRFHETRRWRFDFALLDFGIAIEVEGGIFSQGRHTRGRGYTQDLLKYNAAVTLGWKVLRYTTAQINANVIEDIHKIIKRSNHERSSLSKRKTGSDGSMPTKLGKGD